MRTLIESDFCLEKIWEVVQLEFQKATTVKRHSFRYVVLSSANNESVNSRWVVLRRYTEGGSFLIYTDARSEKVNDFKANSLVSLLFFNDRKGLQVRVNGKVITHHKNELTKKYWPGVKGFNDQSYTSELAPGTPIKSKDEAYKWSSIMDDENFMVLEIVPNTIDVLQLNGSEHIRAQFSADGQSFEGTFLVP